MSCRASSGFLMTLLFVVLSILPIIEVESRLVFAVKISSLIVVTNLAGAAIFVRSRRRRLRRLAEAGIPA